ncbi:hypothetical protein IEO21_04796 [Rhodonia placenta]|uniref:Helicase ATP-binding domain-containing protein n=1 Tax=Rhodonia placenta TaxID=104341 RepID=A0A8H7P354_9APHY|nr:hypothetical protein IEO21_04796 [Postia placenta]
MAKGSKSGPTKAQKSITSFFGGAKARAEPEDVASGSESSDDEVEAPSAETSTKASKRAAPESSDLPPIHDIPSIFSDLVERVPEIKAVAERLQGRKLRVATMCSGTESPLLALELIRRSIAGHHGLNMEFEHVFSCEIEPFKQAYIERNFKPPLLFRDVCELGDSHATTAYGSLAPVPGDVDILIAGTSCVDYSNLNNEKQGIDADGESGRTFRGMMSWVKNHRPPLVILENVCSAPWDRVVDYFKKNNYSATYLRVDTKNFYIPHTRTRVYLLAVDERGSSLPKEWVQWINKLKRPASSTLDAFLLPSDDPRIHQAREKLVSESFNGVDRRTGRTDWNRCESRHQRARLEEELGNKRPLTSWDEGGFCKLPDFAWNDWGIGQVERVWDLMDISLLRSAKKGVDPSYKTQVWNLSQNVDRTIGSNKVGICPCLTPTMIPYITNRGGPMVGLEALSMQGLPVDELLLTRETEDQLADLAGNAMSTTVVGACMMAALIVGRKLLKDGSDERTYESKNDMEVDDDDNAPDDAMDIDNLEESSVSVEDRVSGEDQLVEEPLDLTSTAQVALTTLLGNAEKSARLCECEGRKSITDRQLNRCQDCGSSSCVKCGGRPEHNFEPIDVQAHPRLSPSAFAKELKSTLPMSLLLANVTQESLDDLKVASGVNIPAKRWSNWCAAVLRAAQQELRFVEPKRQDIWAATYESLVAYLELQLHPQQPEWRLFAKPEDHEPTNSEIRKLLEMPIARFVCQDGLFTGRWDFAFPHATSVQISITGDEPVPSWEQKIGLQGKEFLDKQVNSRLKIQVSAADRVHFDRDISGVYTLLDKCGTANSALHRKASGERDAHLPPLFLLLDPTRCGDPNDDSFVISISKRRYEYGETRPIICQLESKWRQSEKKETESVRCHIPYQWTEATDARFVPALGHDARYSVPGDHLNVSVSTVACGSANALLVCRVPLLDQAGPEWPRGTWEEVDKVHERVTFKALAWLIERIRNVGDHFSDWQEAALSQGHANCERCAPTAPALQWTKVKKRVVAIEDTAQAGEYERSLKRRPAPFVTQLKLEDDGVGIVRIGVNIASLTHRAMSRLPTVGRTEKITVSWRLTTDFTPAAKIQLPKFKLLSNRHDEERKQPPSFKIPLRPEQLRSLTWMLAQEATDATPFVEEEISEAILEPLGWRAEARAQRPVHIRGGVLADEVGYGKTAITLGLIDCTSKSVDKEFNKMKDMKGKIAVKATLVVVPPHLTRQWASEVKKFTGKRFKVVVLSTASNLNSLTVDEVQEADIVVVASNLFHSSVYLANLEAFAGAGSLPVQDGRYFNARLETVLSSLRRQVDRLREEGATAVMDQIKEGRKLDDDESNFFVATKRLKGKSYREAATASKTEPSNASSKSNGSSPSVSPRTGMIVEVVIPVSKKYTSSATSSIASTSATEATEEEDSDAPKTRPRRRIPRRAIQFSDEEEEQGSDGDFEPDDEEPKPKRLVKKAIYVKRGKKAAVSSDYEDESAEETQSEEETGIDTSMSMASEDELPKKPVPKSKAKAKPKGKAASKKSTMTSDDDRMDIDEPPPSKGKGKKVTKKRKAEDDDARPAKKKRREDTDPWKLGSHAVKKDWTQMQAPPMEMFHFARKVVDEYTYLDGKIHSMVTNLTAERHWVLSGTPPIHDFGALKTISAFLNLHLGVDDDGEGQSVQVKKRRREQTGMCIPFLVRSVALTFSPAVEKFHSFREVHSLEWHAHRHEIGQTFLDRFVRQNIAEIDEIPSSQELKLVNLPAAERAIYLELEHHLRALDMTVKRGKKSESDREKRVAQALGDSSTAEEALLKRCSHFELETSDKENAMKACEVIVEERTKQLENCKTELLKKLGEALKMEKKIGKLSDESLFQEYVRVTRNEGVGDHDATEQAQVLLDKANVPRSLKSATNQAERNKGKKDEHLSNSTKELIWEHREQTHEIRRLTKELTGRVRSLRYFTAVRDLQRQADTPATVSCPMCEQDSVPIEEVAVLSSCGHMGCLKHVMECAEREECVYAASGACNAAARVLNVVRGSTLGVDDEARDGRGKHYGLKLEQVIHLIRTNTIDVEVYEQRTRTKSADHNSISGLAVAVLSTSAYQNFLLTYIRNCGLHKERQGSRLAMLAIPTPEEETFIELNAVYNYCTMVASVIIFYDYFLTLSQEIALVWSKQFTFVAFVFHVNRYTAFVWSIFNILAVFHWHSPKSCNVIIITDDALFLILYITWAAFSALRVMFAYSKHTVVSSFGIGNICNTSYEVPFPTISKSSILPVFDNTTSSFTIPIGAIVISRCLLNLRQLGHDEDEELVLSLLPLSVWERPEVLPESLIYSTSQRNATKSIAIVGAGSAGLAALKAILDLPPETRAGWEVVLYERRRAVGGVWLGDPPGYEPHPPEVPETPLYPLLKTNTPHPTMTYPHFPFAEGTTLFPRWDAVERYHADFALTGAGMMWRVQGPVRTTSLCT